MSELPETSLALSLARAAQRFPQPPARRRADKGRSRLDPRVEQELQRLLAGPERPRVRDVQRALEVHCKRLRITPPSRATIYNAMERIAIPRFSLRELPDSVRATLHNTSSPVPGHQLVFAAFNQGDTRALSWAASLPWSCLRRAERLPGWRPKSLALLRAVCAARRA